MRLYVYSILKTITHRTPGLDPAQDDANAAATCAQLSKENPTFDVLARVFNFNDEGPDDWKQELDFKI